jgi:predicted acyltransferase
MNNNKNYIHKILYLWIIFSFILGAMVYPLTKIMPINKRIWSISYVFLTSAVTGFVLVFITYIV